MKKVIQFRFGHFRDGILLCQRFRKSVEILLIAIVVWLGVGPQQPFNIITKRAVFKA